MIYIYNGDVARAVLTLSQLFSCWPRMLKELESILLTHSTQTTSCIAEMDEIGERNLPEGRREHSSRLPGTQDRQLSVQLSSCYCTLEFASLLLRLTAWGLLGLTSRAEVIKVGLQSFCTCRGRRDRREEQNFGAVLWGFFYIVFCVVTTIVFWCFSCNP